MGTRQVILVLPLGFFLSATPTRAQDPCDASVESKVAAGAHSIWTGPPGGYYDKVGQALKYSAQHSDLQIVPVTSNGSVQNICALVQGKTDFALVQSDAAHLAWYGEQPFREKYDSTLQLVAPLFTEKVHILTRPHLYIPSPAGLMRPHSVWMGHENSGSELSAQLVLRASGKSQDEITALKATPPPTDLCEAVNRLKTWKLDAIFQTEVAPAKDIADALSEPRSEIRLLGFDWSSVELLVKNGMYIETSLQKTEYPQLDGGIYTVGVEALLLTRSPILPCETNAILHAPSSRL
jgi:TRAP transporter TAXI family solute receptor